MMKLRPRLTKLAFVALALVGAAALSGALLSRSVSAGPAPLISAFLYPPFYGRASEESIFDHSSPTYSLVDNKIVTYQAETLNKACPNPAPPGTPPPNGLCDYGYGGYWSYKLGVYTFYNGHDGIDFGVSYRPVLAAADANQVVYAGWYNPQDHRSNLGIYVRLRHANGYDTWYGHMSAVAIQSCTFVNCADIPHGEVIGVSGTTGNSSGPHLHFRLTNSQVRSIDPYGWAGQAGLDPWPYNQKESLWVQYPNLSGSSGNVYPSGVSLIEPPAPATGYLVDDLDPRFDQIPADCWMVINTSAANSQNGRMLEVQPLITGSDACKARWKLPLSAGPGIFSVYARIPVVHATSEGALYSIVHDGRSETVVLNQAAFPNSSVPDGWVYLGKYYFNAASLEYVQLGNKTQDVSASGLELAADAIRFVPLVAGTAVPSETPTVTQTATITSTPTITITPSITSTPTITLTSSMTPTPSDTLTITPSVTPSLTLTPSPTFTATDTRTPTLTRTATLTRTPTKTPVIRPTDTRWPTLAPSATRTIRPSDTRVPTRTATSVRSTQTRVPTLTPLPTRTPTPTKTFTPTRGPTPTRTPTPTPTPVPSRTPTPSRTPVPSSTPSQTLSVPPTQTLTVTPLPASPTVSLTPGPSPTQTRWPTLTRRPTDTRVPTSTTKPK